VTSSDFQSASPLPANAPRSGATWLARYTVAPASSATCAVASVESESITTTSSTSPVPAARATIAPATCATVRSSLRAGMTTLTLRPRPVLRAASWRSGQSCQRLVRRRNQVETGLSFSLICSESTESPVLLGGGDQPGSHSLIASRHP
jgi:hypothetical protein